MPHYNIEQGVERTDAWRNRASKNQDLFDLLDKLAVDESFTFPASRKASMDSVLATLKKRGSRKQFSVRKEDNITRRIWRVE